MRTFFLLIVYIFFAATVYAAQTCKPNSIPASTPDSQLIDNNDGTVTDLKTGLMWKQCLEGLSGNVCETGSPDSFTWQEALQQPGIVNSGGGFAGHNDWRLPNIRELFSIVEEQCHSPAINLNRFPNTPTWLVWSGSPSAYGSAGAWSVNFGSGSSDTCHRADGILSFYYPAVRLVRGGQ